MTGTLIEGLSLAPAERRTLASDVVERLRDSILNGVLAPGQRLREEVLAESLSVSRGPIREALARLEREGLVVRERNKVAWVAQLTRDDVEEVYSLRLALERLAVTEVFRRDAAVVVAQLGAVLEEMSAAVKRGVSEHENADLDTRFHDLIYRASEHHRLYEAWSDLRPQIQLFILARARANDDFAPLVVPSHKAIVDAIESGDPERAVAEIEEHVRSSYIRVLESFGSEPGATVPAAARPL